MKKQVGNLSIEFTEQSGGFPAKIELMGRAGKSTVLATDGAWLSCVLSDGRNVFPFVPEDMEIFQSHYQEAERIEFRKIPWRDQNGNILNNFTLSLRYELWPDGSCFVNTFFFVEDTKAPDITSFSMKVPLQFSSTANVRWGNLPRPAKYDGTMIQTAIPKRFQAATDEHYSEPGIIPQFSFDYTEADSPAKHIELFMEGQNSLSGDPKTTKTDLNWTNNCATIEWNFQTEETDCHDRPWQWRNQWGWLITNAPAKRHLPPLRMYHYFDNYIRYPNNNQIEKMKAQGADVLILHENWRLDAQNGGTPYDSKEFKRVVDNAHKHGIRIAVYIRGNETSAAEESCDWFDSLLTRDFDGLYMDYGGCLTEPSVPDESYHAGRIHFRRHYLKLRRLRDRVGENGIFYSHTGPLFSALGMTNNTIDGYVSGEGERGIMIKSKEHHHYFSAAYAITGTMWTAAFPEYGTREMIPHLASTGQYPHMPLGTQFKTSSLSHPAEPGVGDKYLRALWRLWSIVKDFRDFDTYNDYNCVDIFLQKSPETGCYLMVCEKAKTALLIATNFADTPQQFNTEINWQKVDFTPTNGWQLSPNTMTPGTPTPISDLSKLTSTIDAYGINGFLFTYEEAKGLELLKEFTQPYPEKDATEIEYENTVDKERSLRFEPSPMKQVYVQISVPNLAVPYEESMWWDLYENAMQLGYYSDDEFHELGWISRNGLVDKKPDRKDFVWPGYSSPWIELHKLLPKGEHSLTIRSIHFDEPFYSFIDLALSPTPDTGDPMCYKLRFYNEIDSDRSQLKFNINLTK